MNSDSKNVQEPKERLISRSDLMRGAGSLALGTAAALAVPSFALAKSVALSFTLPWVAEGSNLIAYVAKGKGFWSRHGLDVSIARGYGSVAAAQAIGEKRFDFGLAAASAGIQQSAKGLPIMQIACTGYDSTMGIGVLAESPIKTPKDLEGRQLASTTTSGEYPFLPALAKRANFDLAKVKPILVDANVRNRLLTQHEADAISGFAISALPVYLSAKVPVRWILYSDYGLRLYNNMLMTQPDRVRSDPALCEAVTDGILQAVKFTLLDPEAAIDVFFQQLPEMNMMENAREQVRLGLGIFRYGLIHPVARTKGLGVSDPRDFESMTNLVMTYVGSPGDKRPAVSDVMTNKFAGRITLSAAEWATAASGTQEFKQLL